MARWRLKDAQKKLPEIPEKASSEGPQTITAAPGRSYTVAATSARRQSKKKAQKSNWINALLACPKGPPLKMDRDKRDTVGKGDPLIFD